MNIGLDYDDTWTRDPDGWYEFCKMMRARGHRFYGVTMRYPREASGMDSRYDEVVERLIFTGRKAKRPFVHGKCGIIIDVWIDDNPIWVEVDASS